MDRLTKEQLTLNKQAVHSTSRAYQLSATQYENGLVTYQRLLSTVDKLTKTQDAYAQIKGNIALQGNFVTDLLACDIDVDRPVQADRVTTGVGDLWQP